MSSLKQYDEAIANYHGSLTIKTVPLVSWEFNHILLDYITSSFLDINKIKTIALNRKWQKDDWDLSSILKEEVIIVTDYKLSIVFASSNLSKMNGYYEEDVLGKSPKMFHGKETCLQTSNEIREAVQQQIPFEKTVVNYKKNGETYNCKIKGFPIFDSKGELCNFIAFEKAA
ncbi:PAS domain-containing protein [Flavobacterium luteum]|uniref:PAS domain-containing protein n=1 Tax=Flavobacterium luteum TaxID=2026654 RepID=A0A7J5AEQ7_9FLAO|nr:PAS domain-containing protein [Flavobacterium luteum]KAB1156040.1 PAS domain-containing protein [Flavobacterium luteum]